MFLIHLIYLIWCLWPPNQLQVVFDYCRPWTELVIFPVLVRSLASLSLSRDAVDLTSSLRSLNYLGPACRSRQLRCTPSSPSSSPIRRIHSSHSLHIDPQLPLHFNCTRFNTRYTATSACQAQIIILDIQPHSSSFFFSQSTCTPRALCGTICKQVSSILQADSWIDYWIWKFLHLPVGNTRIHSIHSS